MRKDKEVFRIFELTHTSSVSGRVLPKSSEALYGEETTCWQQGWRHMLQARTFIPRNK